MQELLFIALVIEKLEFFIKGRLSLETETLRKDIWHLLGFGIKEFSIVLVLGAIYLFMFITHSAFNLFDAAYGLMVLGIIIGIWLALRMSEIAVKGIEALAYSFLGVSAYVAGVLSSVASNAPELALAGTAAYRGAVTNNPSLTEFAVLLVFAAALFNVLLVGIVILIGARQAHSSKMKVPKAVIAVESDLMRATIVMLGLVLVLGIAEYLLFLEPGKEFLPREGAAVLVLTYIMYVVYIFFGKSLKDVKEENGENEAHSAHVHKLSKKTTVALLIVGFAGIAVGAELITHSVEIFFEFNPATPIIIISVLIGASSSIPEHAIALISARKGQLHLALGNTLAGVLQSYTLIIGFIGIIALIPLNPAIIFQLAVGVAVVYLIKTSILDDGYLDIYEGIIIITVMAFSLILLIQTFSM
jgi:Ca2+/Na+ antiporter